MGNQTLLRLANRVVRVQPGEASALVWSFCYFFCLLSAYYILRPVRDEMGIQGGVENLQWLFSGTFLTMLAAVPLFGWMAARLPRRRLLPLIYLFFAANLFVFFVLLETRTAPALVAHVFFVWVSVFNLFVVSLFWSFMADLYRNEQARRLFGCIAAGGSTGALVGPALTARLAPEIGIALLLPLSAFFLLGAMLCIERLLLWANRQPQAIAARQDPSAERALGGGVLAGITLLLRSDYLLGITLYVVLYTLLSTFLYFQQAIIVSTNVADPGDRTALFAAIDLAVNALTLFGQIFVVGRLIERLGVTAALLLLPALAAAGFLLLGVFPTLAVLVALQVIRRAGEYAITRPAREILFTVVSREEKYKAKNVIDTVVFRAGDAVGGWLFEGLRILGLGFASISFVAVPVAILWTITGYLLGRRQEQLRAMLSARKIDHHAPSLSEPTPLAEAGGRDESAGGRPAAAPR
ncbi:MAG TPA: MFS transporter [Burkholderiales bacterium]|nr:MFS transporter [Burkholderiales bacterium]